MTEDEDEDRATLDEDSSEGRVAEPPSSPQAAKKKTTQTVQIDNGTFVEKNENRGKWIIVIVILCALAVPTLLFAIKKK